MKGDLAQSKKHKNQRGAVLSLVIIGMTLILGMIAIAIDSGHLFLVRVELKKAADAAALAGASYLYPTDSDGKPNWSVAYDKAVQAISLNKADDATLVDAQVQTGYWDLTGTISGIRAPASVPNPGPDDIAAVMVTLAKATGENGGPVNLYFGSIVGVSTKDVSAHSVGVSGSPSGVDEETLFPVALPVTLYDDYWDPTSEQPKIDPVTGHPFVFDISSEGTKGQWTSFDMISNDVPTIQNLILNGNPTPLDIGQSIHVAPGVKTSIYHSVPSNIDVSVAIVSDTSSGGSKQIVGFGTLHIHFATGGSSKSITVNLIDNHKTMGAKPGGSYYGTYAPAKLAY